MAFDDLPQFSAPIALLRRSLAKGRLAHAYLLTGESLDDLELLARNLAKVVNCAEGQSGPDGNDACDQCLSCRKIDHLNHADVQWIRPEMKSRVISVGQIRDLLQTVYLKPVEARLKVVVLVAADRLNVQAANAFLKTLEEPPSGTLFLLLSSEPQRLLETILSRCLRLHCGGGGPRVPEDAEKWIGQFSAAAAVGVGGLFGRYQLLDQLLERLAGLKEEVDKSLTEQSPIERYDDADPKLIERWKDELTAGIEAEYRRRRGELLIALQLWLRDVWLVTRTSDARGLAVFPGLTEATNRVASRIDARKATQNLEILENTQRLLHTNVQEALALEIGLLKLAF
ncbi:MAG TPA: hypothetical protein DCY13_09815 [Verrucomicrobiales bacterium]|nr:hypothetical protein [Verrucomicrobiales bacterium]